MGEVYRARDSRLGREIALKILPAEFSTSRERLDRFEQEARSASALNHPNIITIYDVGSSNSISYLCMELVEGKSLRDVLNEGPIPFRRAVTIASQLADGLAKAHAAGIVHRDLKPENLMISKDGFLKILDFGLAKMTLTPTLEASNLQTQTGVGMLVGTAGYMSPEQASGKSIDFRSDQFSFGAILYEMITGKRPFKKNTAAETMAAIIRDEPESLNSLNPQTPPVLRWIVDRCMAKDPEDRYASTRDLARDLQAIRDHISEVNSPTAIAAQPPKRFRFLIPSLILIAFLAGAALTYWLIQPKPLEPIKMTTLTYSGKDYSPAVSPDGKLIAFCSDRSGSPRIWIKQLTGGSEVVLTSGTDDYPRFSSDGSTIYFIRHNKVSSSSLYRIPVVGGVERKILDNVQSADVSPDGKKIAFLRWQSGNSMLFLANTDGSGTEQVTSFNGKVLQHPRWSQDGKKIAIVRTFGSNTLNTDSILVLDLQTKKEQWMGSTWPTAAIWTSEKQLLYGVSESASAIGPVNVRLSGKIVVQNILSENIRSLFWFPSSGDILDIVKNNSIVLNNYSTRENLRQISLKDNSAARWFTQGNSIDRQPVYSPDGERMLFSSIGSGNLDLMEIVISTGEVKRITEDSADDWDPVYSRDGKYIFWSSTRSGHFEVWMANADGTDAHRVTNDGTDAENPSPTPDNKWIFYNSYNAEKRGLWKIHPDGSGAVHFIPGLIQWPEVSPDGKYIAYASYKDSLADTSAYVNVVEIETKASVFQIKTSTGRDIRSIAFGGLAGRVRWMPDGKSIAYIDQSEEGQLGVFLQEFIPGKDTYQTRKPVAGFDPSRYTETFSISPDGAFITIAEMEVFSNLVLAENVPAFNR